MYKLADVTDVAFDFLVLRISLHICFLLLFRIGFYLSSLDFDCLVNSRPPKCPVVKFAGREIRIDGRIMARRKKSLERSKLRVRLRDQITGCFTFLQIFCLDIIKFFE